VVGSGLSLGLFILQVIAYRGPSFVADWVKLVNTRNTVLYVWKDSSEAPLSNNQLMQLFSAAGEPNKYEVPKDFVDFLRHAFFMITGRFDEPLYLIPIGLLVGLMYCGWRLCAAGLEQRRRPKMDSDASSSWEAGVERVGVAFAASVIAFVMTAVPFRGYISFLYLMQFEPLLDMVVALGLTYASLLVVRGAMQLRLGEWASVTAAFLAVILGAFLLRTSSGRWESKVGMAVPLSSELVHVIMLPKFDQQRVATNFDERYVFVGWLGKPPVFVPLQLATERWGRPSTVRYYVCSEQAAVEARTGARAARLLDVRGSQAKTCAQALSHILADGGQLIYRDKSGYIVDWWGD